MTSKALSVIVLLLLVLSFTYCDSIDAIKSVIANLEATKINLQKEFNNSAIHQELKQCQTTLPYLESKIKKINEDKILLEQKMQTLVADYIKLKDKKPEYEKELAAAVEEWEKQKEELAKQVKIVLEFIKYLKNSVAAITNPKTEEPKKKIIELLEAIEKYYNDELNNMTPPASVEKLKLKIQNLEQTIIEQDKKIEQAKIEYITIQELLTNTTALLSTQTKYCQDKAIEKDAMIKKLEEDIIKIDAEIVRLNQEIKRLEEELRKQQERERIMNEIATQSSLLNDTQVRLNASLAQQAQILASDPKPECDATLPKLNEPILAYEAQEKNLTETMNAAQAKVAELTPIVNELNQNSTTTFAQYSAKQQLCNDLASAAVQDPSLLRQIAAIQKLIDIVAEYKSAQKLSNSTADSITTLLMKIEVDLKNLLTQRFEEAKKNAADCRAAEAILKASYESIYTEYKAKKAALGAETAKVASLTESLAAVQAAKKVAIKLYQDKVGSCTAAIAAWTSSKETVAADISKLQATVASILQEIENLKKKLALI